MSSATRHPRERRLTRKRDAGSSRDSPATRQNGWPAGARRPGGRRPADAQVVVARQHDRLPALGALAALALVAAKAGTLLWRADRDLVLARRRTRCSPRRRGAESERSEQAGELSRRHEPSPSRGKILRMAIESKTPPV